MRIIGQLQTEERARRFCGHLFFHGITSEVEIDRGHWAIWIHSEDEMEEAKRLFAKFLGNPDDPEYERQALQAVEMKAKAESEEEEGAEKAERRYFDRGKVFRRTMPYGMGYVTLVLVLASVGVSLLSRLGSDLSAITSLFITTEGGRGLGLPEVMRGEVWRLLTPIFVHFGPWHILFNMLWLFDLGSMVEGRESRRRLMLLVVVIGVLSNFGQYFQSGSPLFGGMSGVVYGLLGYIWMKGKFDPGSGLFLHSQTVMMMLIWFFLCLAGVIPRVANTAHGVGLVVGMAWGYLSSHLAQRNR